MSRPKEKSSAAGGGAAEPSRGTPPQGRRKERGDQASSRKHPPHVTENDETAPLQDGHEPAAADIPSLPATAHGSDKAGTAEEAQPIDEESMYEQRREEHKDHTPTDRTKS